jgi:hypothetical protein
MLKKFEKYVNGLHWVYENEKGDNLSIICHDFSYGGHDGLFEVFPSWQKDVIGYCTFAEVADYLYQLEKR